MLYAFHSVVLPLPFQLPASFWCWLWSRLFYALWPDDEAKRCQIRAAQFIVDHTQIPHFRIAAREQIKNSIYICSIQQTDCSNVIFEFRNVFLHQLLNLFPNRCYLKYTKLFDDLNEMKINRQIKFARNILLVLNIYHFVHINIIAFKKYINKTIKRQNVKFCESSN